VGGLGPAVTYSVKEVFYTLQGEGQQAGRPAVFCRFAGCNLWSGRETDRAEAICRFCDTDFVGTDGLGGGKFDTPAALAAHVASFWPDGAGGDRFVVCTGGEPLLQLDVPLIGALHDAGFQIAVESNGSVAAPPGIDWLCVSPKAEATLAVSRGDELKLVYPQSGADPARYEALGFTHWYLQPMDGPERGANSRQAIDYCLAHPKWRLSIQSHKYLGIP